MLFLLISLQYTNYADDDGYCEEEEEYDASVVGDGIVVEVWLGHAEETEYP